MIDNLRYTLISDGSSDKVLLPVLTWLLRNTGIHGEIEANWVDFRVLQNPPRTLDQKIVKAVEMYPCELLFIHRDSEKESREKRCCEIFEAFLRIPGSAVIPPRVCVVPVRMQEAWLLFDEPSIRMAAGNPNGTKSIDLPALHSIELHQNPKKNLHQALRDASGLKGRRLKSFPVRERVHRLGEIIADFSPLLELSAFEALRNDLKIITNREGWMD